jgi:uncharacterized membrane protein YqaE (UPF0057 family)
LNPSIEANQTFSDPPSEFQLPSSKESKMDLLRIFISVLLPPLGVFLQVGFAGAFWLNIVLTLLGYIPGLIHAIWIIARR